jgi:hypothetical protein
MSADATAADELAAMRKLVAALEPLDAATRRRVLTWLAGRYGLHVATSDASASTDG